MSELEENIKSSVTFSNVSATGYYTMKCPMCHDTQIRAGFKFEPNEIIYNCFRGKCDASCSYTYGEYMNKKFRNLMRELHVDIPLEFRTQKFKPKSLHELNDDIYEKHYYKEIELPSDFIEYDPEKWWWFDEKLKERHVDFNRQLYVGTEDQWKNRLIIPFYYRDILIGWQGYNDRMKTPYLTSSGNSDILFINSIDNTVPKTPIIVEGIMDAAVLPNSVATLGNTVSKKQAYFLRNSDPILVPDRKDSKFIDVAKKYGWRISIPDWKVKDVNAAVKKYGIFVTAKMIHDGIQVSMLKAETRYRIWKT